MQPSVALSLALLLTACNLPSSPHQGPLEPQTVEGPCRVQNFFLLPVTLVHTTITFTGDGTCAFTLVNPDLQAFPTATVITAPPAHGRATATLTNGGRSPLITYTPQPGSRAPDHFTVTIEPNDHAVSVAVAP